MLSDVTMNWNNQETKSGNKSSSKRMILPGWTYLHGISILIFCFPPLCQSDGMVSKIWTYQPHNDVSNLGRLSADLRLMDELLMKETEESLQLALQIYQKGAHSDPYAELTVEGGIPYDLPKGAALTGVSNMGVAVTVYAAFSSYKAGDKKLKVEFSTNSQESYKDSCVVAGIDKPRIDGCLETDGELYMEGKPKAIRYTYTLDDISTYHKLENLSKLAASKFRTGGNGEYMDDFVKMVEFFGAPDFAHQIVMAAFDKSKFRGSGTRYPDFVLDFSLFSMRARRSVIVHTIAYMIVTPFAVRELQVAIDHCDRVCTSYGTCNPDSVRSLDGAVALYTGSVFQETNSGGNFLFGLANHMCKVFKTCGPDGTLLKGTAKVNYDIFREFALIQGHLVNGTCLEGKKAKERLVREMVVPLYQASYLAIHMDIEKDTMETRAERVVFVTTVLPLIAHCAPGLKWGNLHDTNMPIFDDEFATFKKTMEERYRCMGGNCLLVGGIWDEQTKAYLPGAETCYVPPEENKEPKSKLGLHIILILVFGGGGFAIVTYFAVKRYLFRQRRLRDFEDDSDDENGDDYSVGAGNLIA